MLGKTFSPSEVEPRHYERWEKGGAFESGRHGNAKPYTIMMPPANVTGSLHIGHSLTFTIQDILIRYYRMQGRDALWQPGTDHAGIATQMVVERQMAEEGLSRHDLGRAAFLDRVWDWKEQSGGTIMRQLRRLGASAHWQRERFTMDEGLSQAVRRVFVDLYGQGLIYKDKRLVNWDPKLHTAISDLEVEPRDIKGHLWHFRYPIEGEEGHIVVATTRPETMLGDSGVAVHPDDDRYSALVGKKVVLPLVGRKIPVVADDYADPETGSGAVKITPAHDFNDFEVGRRHDLELINIFDENAHLNDAVPETYRGLDRYEARKRVVEDLEQGGYLVKVEDHQHVVPYGDRGGVAIEPWLTDQWYVDAATLAKPAIEAVEQGRTRFVPQQWENTYFEWMRNIQPWCISRQIWWGHQIPAWYGPDGETFVDLSEADAKNAAAKHYGREVELTQDNDVLDTWFSSALWPFSTLGWPAQTPELARYYPGDVLVTGFDIIFFWVARMMMMGLHFMGEVPFRTVYIHGLVRDERGQKMSKSKGNIMDPLDIVDRYGCDALRFTLAALAVPAGRDVKLSESRVEGYRNFATKLWNAARFCEMNEARLVPGFDPATPQAPLNRWIISQVVRTGKELEEAFESYRFNDVANTLYHFAWHSFCDWYVEFSKPILSEGDEQVAAETRATTAWVLAQLIHMLSPVMPFITEELWQNLAGDESEPLINREWPSYEAKLIDVEAESEMTTVINLISGIRAVRAEMNVPPGSKVPLILKDASAKTMERVTANKSVILRLARLSNMDLSDQEIPKGSVQIPIDEATAILPVADVIDIAQEKTRLIREGEKVQKELAKLNGKLGNKQFLAKAPVEVVEEQKARLESLTQTKNRLQLAISKLESL